ncbi:MAG: CvpA family protein [Clostridia bacterium]|nr:CvpA family protein [Clostridia bacterium]
MDSLLAAGAWTIDVVFFVIIIFGILLGVRRGFIRGICKLAGTILSVIVAVTFCVAMQASLERSFGATTSLNNAIGAPFGEWIMVVLSFILLILIVKIGCWFLGSVGSAIVDRVAPIRILNMLLGGILGAFKAFILLFIILLIFKWLPNDSLHDFISSSSIVGTMFQSQWFIDATHLNFHL